MRKSPRRSAQVNLAALIAIGISMNLYMQSLHSNCANLRLECLAAMSLVISYCVVSVACFARFTVDAKYRKKILSSKFVSGGLTVGRVFFASLTMVLIPHYLLPIVVYHMDIELVSVVMVTFFVLCISMEGFSVRVRSLVAIAAGVLLAVLGFNFSLYSVANPISIFYLFVVIISFMVGVSLYRRSTLMEDVMVSAMLLMISPTVISMIILFARLSLQQIKHELASLTPHVAKLLFELAVVFLPVLLMSLTFAIPQGSLSYFGLSSVFELAGACGSWVIHKARRSDWKLVLAVLSGCFLMIYGSVETVDSEAKYEELPANCDTGVADASVLDDDFSINT